MSPIQLQRFSFYLATYEYKDVEWKQEWFFKHPKMYWESIDNQKEFLNNIALLLHIKNPIDWGKVTTQQFVELGGRSLLNYYKNSLFLCLQSVYKGPIQSLVTLEDIKWKREWFIKLPNSYWKSMENRKKFLDEVALKLNINSPKDWGKVTQHLCNELGGSGLLRYYNGSIFACVQSIYKGIYRFLLFADVDEDIQWKKSWFANAHQFPKKHWESLENCKKFMEDIAVKSKVFSEKDWRKVSLTLIRQNGGEVNKFLISLNFFRGSFVSIMAHCERY